MTLILAVHITLTLILLTWTKWWAPASASKWRMGFNSAFKGLTPYLLAKKLWRIFLSAFRNTVEI